MSGTKARRAAHRRQETAVWQGVGNPGGDQDQQPRTLADTRSLRLAASFMSFSAFFCSRCTSAGGHSGAAESRSNAGGWRRRGGWPWDSWSGVAAVPTTQGSMQCKWQAPAALGAPTAGALPARTHHLALHAPYFGSDHALALAHHLPRLLLLPEAQFLQERFLGQHLGELRRQAAAIRCNCKQVQEPCNDAKFRSCATHAALPAVKKQTSTRNSSRPWNSVAVGRAAAAPGASQPKRALPGPSAYTGCPAGPASNWATAGSLTPRRSTSGRHLHAGLAAAATAAMERSLPLLDLPPNVLLGVFSKLTELADAGEWTV